MAKTRAMTGRWRVILEIFRITLPRVSNGIAIDNSSAIRSNGREPVTWPTPNKEGIVVTVTGFSVIVYVEYIVSVVPAVLETVMVAVLTYVVMTVT